MSAETHAERASEISRKHVVRLACGYVAERRPAAFVRFGEGEARLLAANRRDPHSLGVARRKLYKQTGLIFPPDEILKVRALILSALDQADVVGLRGGPRFSDEHQGWMAYIGEVFAERAEHRTRPAYIAHCLFHHDIHADLETLLREQPEVSVVSCRDVRDVLVDLYGIAVPTVYKIPSQYAVRQIDGEYEAELHATAIWPRFYAELLDGLNVRTRGEVFLVGAGLLGKSICVAIRDRGGIALDMGSVLDQLADKTTRGTNKPRLVGSGPQPRAEWPQANPGFRARLARKLRRALPARLHQGAKS
jgi:hypothetical protein